MLPDSPDVEDVLVGEGGVLDAAREGALVIDFSTIRPDVARRLAADAGRRGMRMLDAPVSGGQAGAEAATLSIMVGGAAEDVRAALEVLDVVGGTVVHVGPAGAGQTVKAANQLVVAGHLQVLAEAVVLLDNAVGRHVWAHLRAVEDRAKVEALRLVVVQRLPHVQQVAAADYLVQAAVAHGRQVLADFFGDEAEEVHDVLSPALELLA